MTRAIQRPVFSCSALHCARSMISILENASHSSFLKFPPWGAARRAKMLGRRTPGARKAAPKTAGNRRPGNRRPRSLRPAQIHQKRFLRIAASPSSNHLRRESPYDNDGGICTVVVSHISSVDDEPRVLIISPFIIASGTKIIGSRMRCYTSIFPCPR